MPEQRYIILADIHGVCPALEAVLAAVQKDSPDGFIVAGDFVGGPQPHETLTRLRELPCQFILGNGELNLLRMHRGTAPQTWWEARQFDLARWSFDRLTEDDFQFLASLPEKRILHLTGTGMIRVVHAFPWGPGLLWNEMLRKKNLPVTLGTLAEDVLIFAHDHIPGIYRSDEKLALNPGSLSNNLDGTPGISYGMLTWDGAAWQPEICQMTLPLEILKEVFIGTGFLEATQPLGRAVYESTLTGENVPLAFYSRALKMAEEAGSNVDEYVPDAYWLAAGARFPWQIKI